VKDATNGMPSDVTQIAELPHWRTRIYPQTYEENRINDSVQCLDVLERVSVRSAGWRYPFVSRDRDRFAIRKNFAEAWISSGEYVEFSRQYTSGQFFYVTALREAFLSDDSEPIREAQELARLNGIDREKWPTGVVSIVRLMRLVSIAFMNAQRLADEFKISDDIVVDMRLANVAGRVLITGDPMRELDEYYQATESNIDYDVSVHSVDLRANTLRYGLEATKHFYSRFTWLDPTEFVLQGLQDQALA